jgi:hypothetical protein
MGVMPYIAAGLKTRTFAQFANAASPLTTPSYDGSGQTVEPSVHYFATPWNGYKYWMAISGYTNANDLLENPCILASNDGQTWALPTGVTNNPLEPAPATDHNNDTEIFYNSATDELWIYYLWTNRASNGGDNHNYLILLKSGDGFKTYTKTTVLTQDLSVSNLYVSPTVDKVGSTYYLWMVDAVTFAVMYATSTDGATWSAFSATNIGSNNAWHHFVRYLPTKSKFLTLIAYPNGSSTYLGHLFMALSSDGITWTVPKAVMTQGGSGSPNWDANIYRSTFFYHSDTDIFEIWYGGNSTGNVWRTGYTSYNGGYDVLAAYLNS